VVEPATGAKITSVGNATAADVRKAAAEARAAQPGWGTRPCGSVHIAAAR
jgi:acyl-CoA reductase-like NAD-dependent aldehyde dehydrogenase